MKELEWRVRPLTARLKKYQPKHGLQLRQLNLGLVAVLMMLMDWPDHGLAKDLVIGFSLVGHWLPQVFSGLWMKTLT